VTSATFGSRSKQTLVIYICSAYRKPNGYPANDSGGMVVEGLCQRTRGKS